MQTTAFAAPSSAEPLAPWTFERRAVGPHDVQIKITHCGVCHSDIHATTGDWGANNYPFVPGHEIVGVISAVGEHVQRYKVGDIAAVGCIVDSCRVCEPCAEGEEQLCEKGMTGTYGGTEKETGRPTYGGYSKAIVVNENYVLSVPKALDPARAAPLLCAGITTYSPLRHWKVGAGQKVGVVGLGGLGHMGVKFAKALGAHVVVLTSSKSKVQAALDLGADDVVVSSDVDQMKAHRNSFHFILNTVSASLDLDPYAQLLRRNGVMTLVGAPGEPHKGPNVFTLLMGRRSIAGSPIGGIAETQEMLDFCAQHDIGADIELIPIQAINEAWERVQKGDIRYRFVIDMSTLAEA